MTRNLRRLVAVNLGALLLAVSGSSAYAATHHYVVTNDDNPSANSVSVFEVTGPVLTHVTTVLTGGTALGGGYFAQVDQSIAQDASNTCVFAGDAASGDIAAMKVISASPYLQVVSDYLSPDGDSGANIGLGIAISGGYLYANYTATPSIGVWKIGTGCTLSFVTHLTGTSGINGGAIDGMTVTPNGNYLIVGYGDGSIGSYAIGGGSISLIGQEIIAGNSVGGGAYAGSAIVSANGNWAIFGDFSGSNTTQLDVAAIGSNGVLAPTTTYGGTGSLGSGIDSNGIQLSPDNRFIYVVDSLSGQETTVAFNATTGVISYPHACLTNLNGYNTNWVFASQVAAVTTTGAGGGLYISEGFLTSDSYIALLQVNPTTGCATEVPGSPFPDTAWEGLESISAYSH
ncbi:MAG TPA: hypothetical protein VKR57_04215 [Terriglobales bacterium]|jgi:hypothetical protein|nr:hypothetical protein [Terriglobales bacterium]